MSTLTVRSKIQLGVLALIIGILGLAFTVMYSTMWSGPTDPGAALEQFAREFDHYRRTEAEAMYASVSVATDVDSIEGALTKGDRAAAAEAFARPADDMRKALGELDFQVLLSAQGDPIVAHGPPDLAQAIHEWRSFSEALSDISIKDAIEYHGGEGYQVTAEPFYSTDNPTASGGRKRRVGVLFIGRKLSSMLREFVNEHQNRTVTLAIARDGKVFSSDSNSEAWSGLTTALIGHGTGSFAATVNGVPHDVAWRPIDACDNRCANIAQIAVFRSRAPIQAERKERLVTALISLLGVLVVAMGGGWVLARWITRPIEGYVEATAALARGGGDLTHRLDASTDDELGRLGRNLNKVFAQIGHLAEQVKGRAAEVGASSEEILAASRALLEGAAEQASRIQSTGAATTEMSASIQQVATSAADANDVAKRSGAAIEDAVSRMAQIRDAVDRAAHRMSLLGETGKRIGSIVDTIHQIADQTSLLALNAAIEAAHAGEHGRGFTVVADAVGNLANRVDRSAKEIDELIGHIRSQTEEALQAMAAGKREVELGTKLIGDSIAGIKQVLSVFDDTTAAVKEQAIASDEIARNMDAVGRIAQEVLVTSRQAVAQGDRLTGIAASLEEAVSGFRLDGANADSYGAAPSLAARSGTVDRRPGQPGDPDRPLLKPATPV